VTLLLASAAFARPPELPSELRGRVELKVKRCRPIGGGDALLEAHVKLRAKRGALELPPLQCGAYDDDGTPFFLAPVTSALRLRRRETQELTVRVAADAQHRECGCTFGGTRALADERDVAASAPDSLTSESAEAPPLLIAPPRLRWERMLAAHVALREAPSASAASVGAQPAGARLAVDRIERGWKLARTSDGLAGWLPADASTPDIFAPERMSERLAPLREALRPSSSTSEALCSSLRQDALGDLVAAWRLDERAVYVRPLWFALTPEDRAAALRYAGDCLGVTRVMDAMTGREIRREPSRATE
jgi:hypothetical protein